MMANIGRYEIRGELGRGAMAVVWDAWDPVLLRHVAIKELVYKPGIPPWLAEEMSSRFVQEGRLAARLVHPGIVTIHEADEIDGRSIIVMEKLEGTPLSQLIDQHRLSSERTWDILSQLLDAIVYAHSLGVVHRDIKPDNIYVTHQGLVKLTDFGIAGLATAPSAGDEQVISGSPGYMAPEQAQGKPINASTDLFSFSVLAYEMLALENPFGATSGASREEVLLRSQAAADLPPFKDIPAISEVILKGMSPNPKGRYQDSEKYRKALNAAFERERYQFLANAKGKAFALEGAPTSHFEAINISVPKPRDDKGRLLLIAAAALVLVAVFGFVANAMPVVLLAVAALLASLGYWMCINSKQGEAGRARPVSGPGNAAISVDAPPAAEHRPQIGLRVTLPSGELHTCTLSLPATIGRNRQLGDLTLNDPAISRYHLRVELREGQMYARDLGSYNGSELNGRALVGEVPLQAADRLTLGATSLEVL